MNELLTKHTTAETNVYYCPITGLWFAEIGIWYHGHYVMGITRGGYSKQSTAKQQVTRLYNQRFQIVEDFSTLYNDNIDIHNGKVVAIGKVDMWKRDNGQFAIRYACDTRTEYYIDFYEAYEQALNLADVNFGSL